MTSLAIFGIMSGMRTMIILATVALGAMRLVLRTLSPTPQIELAREWTADE